MNKWNQGGVLTVVTYLDIVFIDNFGSALDEISCWWEVEASRAIRSSRRRIRCRLFRLRMRQIELGLLLFKELVFCRLWILKKPSNSDENVLRQLTNASHIAELETWLPVSILSILSVSASLCLSALLNVSIARPTYFSLPGPASFRILSYLSFCSFTCSRFSFSSTALPIILKTISVSVSVKLYSIF